MGAGITIVLVVLIICASVLFGTYMVYCFENKVGMFRSEKHEKKG